MKRLTIRPVRGTTWAFAALVLSAFCWLGFAASKFGAIFQGIVLPLSMPAPTRIILAYGSVGLPVFGVCAVGVMIFMEVLFPSRWTTLALTILFMFVRDLLFRSVDYFRKLYGAFNPAVRIISEYGK